MFREQVENFLRAKFHEYTMEAIRDVIKKKDTCVIEIIMFYEIKGKKTIKMYRVLSCVIYSLI